MAHPRLKAIWQTIRPGVVEALILVRDAGLALRRRPWIAVLALIAVAACGLAVWPYDHAWADWFARSQEARHDIRAVAARLRKWGSFIDTPVIFAVLMIIGWKLKRPDLQRAALACLMAACVAGLIANTLRFTTGRPRPRAADTVADGFYGPHLFRFEMQSFPSGHIATSVGNAVGLSVACPPLAIPALASAAGVTWGCLYVRAHWPTDAAIGIGLGAASGIAIGLAARRRMRQALPLGTDTLTPI